jgi:hypothetical protein
MGTAGHHFEVDLSYISSKVIGMEVVFLCENIICLFSNDHTT